MSAPVTVRVIQGRKGPALDFNPLVAPEVGEFVELARPAGRYDWKAHDLLGSGWTSFRVVPVFPARPHPDLEVGAEVEAVLDRIVRDDAGLPRYAFARVLRVLADARTVREREERERRESARGGVVMRLMEHERMGYLSREIEGRTGRTLFAFLGATEEECVQFDRDPEGRFTVFCAVGRRLSDDHLDVIRRATEALGRLNRRYIEQCAREAADILLSEFHKGESQ